MFEVNGVYANRKGEYKVLAISPPKMRVRYTKDGSEADLKIELQARIWENIAAEYEASHSGRAARAAKRAAANINHYIKIISVPEVDEMNFAGWPEVVMASLSDNALKLKPGDRLIFYAVETQTFFAVATINEEAIKANPKEYFFTVNVKTADFFPIDIDAVSSKLDKGADIDAVELESQPNFARLPLQAEAFLPISEDDFELLAEALTEVAEDDEDEDDEDEMDEELFEESIE